MLANVLALCLVLFGGRGIITNQKWSFYCHIYEQSQCKTLGGPNPPPPRTPHWLCPRANLHNGAAGALCQHYDGRSVVGRCRCRGTARHLVAQSATAASSRARSRRPENFSAHASHSGAHDVGVRPPRWTDCVALTLILRVGRSGPR